MKKKIVLALIVMITSFVYIGCNDDGKTKNRSDIIEVYDKSGTMILEIKDQETLNYFSTLIVNTTKNMNDDNYPLLKLPKDAEVSYNYKFITRREDGKENTIDFFVYKNYPYITLRGIPIITPMTWQISEEENIKLQHPNK